MNLRLWTGAALAALALGLCPAPAASQPGPGDDVTRQANGRRHVLVQTSELLGPRDREALMGLGVVLLDRRADGWIAEADAAGLEALQRYAIVRSVTPVPPETKLSRRLDPAAPFPWQQRPGGRVAYSVLFYKGVAPEEVRRLAAGPLRAELENFAPHVFGVVRAVVVVIDPARLRDLAAYDAVQSIEPTRPPTVPDNQDSSQVLSRVDLVQAAPHNLTGAGVVVGVVEAGNPGTTGGLVRPTHLDLAGRVTVRQPGRDCLDQGLATGCLYAAPSGAAETRHALHVAGTIAGSGATLPLAEGMAPRARIMSWSSETDIQEMAEATAAGALDRIVASNHSYGEFIGWPDGPTTITDFIANLTEFGAYTNESVQWDELIAGDGRGRPGAELVVLKSAGNHRNDGPPAAPPPAGVMYPPQDCPTGYDCIGPAGSAKNVITVGAVNATGAKTALAGGATPAAIAAAAPIAAFSSFGPTDDGRLKPDVVASGVGVRSLGDAAGAQTDTGSFVTGGTSMAAPVVTGIVALMTEALARRNYAPPGAAAYKAMLIQTARDVTAAPAQVGPDFATGYGVVDAEAVIGLINAERAPGFRENRIWQTGPGGARDYFVDVSTAQPELKVTLVWSDPPGVVGEAGALVNDLDLRLIEPGTGREWRPWRLDPASPARPAVRDGGDNARDNVEQVSAPNPRVGLWIVRVSAKPPSLDLGAQDFALAGPILAGPPRPAACALPPAVCALPATLTFLAKP